MPTREKFAIREFYHVYNRGVDERSITKDSKDAERFIQSLRFFNSVKPTASLREVLFSQNNKKRKFPKPIVEIICYALNPNHYHFLLREIYEGGISEFMKRLNGGYTWYFNNRYRRSGALFQGRFKSVHIASNEQLLHSSVYINLNERGHKISGSTAGRVRSSWAEYMMEAHVNFCKKDIILKQFKSVKDYRYFAESSLKEILRMKKDKNTSEMIIGRYMF